MARPRPQLLGSLTLRLLGIGAYLLLLAGCGPAFWQGVSQGMASASGAGTGKIMLFGGPGHETYLGCLNCSEYSSDSVFNQYGSHGSSYGAESIHNAYGQFGSKYSNYSACNPYATDPPVVVDGNGNYYGRLTVNRYHSKGTFGDADVFAWLEAVCG